MNELVQFCRQDSNAIDVRQGRILMNYVIASLLRVDYDTTVTFTRNGIAYRVAMFQ